MKYKFILFLYIFRANAFFYSLLNVDTNLFTKLQSYSEPRFTD